eukprot:g4588.t1
MEGRPDSKALIRHKDIHLCPLSAISIYFYDRFVMQDEKELDIVGNPSEWFDVKVFRSNAARHKPLCIPSTYNERKRMIMRTGTLTVGAVNYADRTIGSYIAKMSNVEDREIEGAGLWGSSSVMGFHYTKIRTSDTIARLSGFACASEYYIHRATLSLFDVAKFASKDDQAMFKSFLSFLDNKEVEMKLLEIQQQEGYNSGINTFRVLSFVCTVFWQDAAILYCEQPNLEIFGSLLIVNHLDTFKRWLEFVCKFEDRIFVTSLNDGNFEVNVKSQQVLEASIAELKVGGFAKFMNSKQLAVFK